MLKNYIYIISLFLISYTLSAQTVSGIRMITLSEYNLAKLGIRITDDGVYYTENNSAFNEGISTYKPRKILLTKNSIKVKTPSKNKLDNIPSFAPVFAVNVFSNGSVVYYSQSKDLNYKFDSTGSLESPANSSEYDWINQLVCIHVEFAPKSKNKQKAVKNHAYLWYKVNSHFLESLPIDVAEPIWSELFTPSQGLENSPYGRFTDSWRGFNNLITTKPLYPNPAGETTTLEFNLFNSTNITISLYDISGQKNKDFVNFQPYQSGKSSVLLNINDISNGMYLVVITPIGAEPVVQRLIISH